MDDFLQSNPCFAEIVLSAEYEDMKKDDIAKHCGVTRQTIHNWEKRVDWAVVLRERRKKYAKELCQVDAAVLRTARGGSVPAAELAYTRWDGWVPTSKVLSEEVIPDAELDEAINGFVKLIGDGDSKAVGFGEAQETERRADAVLQAKPGAEEVH